MQFDRVVHDKVFSPFIFEDEIALKVKNLSHQIQKDYTGDKIVFVAILNGAFMFASDLLKEILCDIQISFVKVSSYIGTETSGRVDELIGLNTDLDGKHVIILEDIVDTGITIDKIISLLNDQKPLSVEVCTLLFKPDAFLGKQKPKYIGFSIPNKFVVGYGLDYDELGRNFKEIYQLKEI